jgi:hypothetical protein
MHAQYQSEQRKHLTGLATLRSSNRSFGFNNGIESETDDDDVTRIQVCKRHNHAISTHSPDQQPPAPQNSALQHERRN